ncbi:leucine-rich repeat-containing protein kinase family protein [Leptolyngbya iicbica]|uniref:Protein kinase n=2 Tax=Cyanophyceae TaxID=3028117 RepID=A0A4Q7DZQ8_9CYAN|nr:leucine-rich repeat-containing protein kinase family protein [Leptolyngbya sp. LK]RZM74116.1 protein kinase [Leptolyngbya sp. LK]
MATLEELQSGEMQGVKRLSLSDQLTQFPPEIFGLADGLEILDLSNNRLSALPDDLPRLHQLKVLFLNNNQFEAVPEVLAQCPQLSMISFKANQLKTLSETALPLQTRWLILTNNQLTTLPASLGQLSKLQKLMLAGNHLQALPEELATCHNLELIRLAANQLSVLPNWLLSLPRLAWLAYAGNPFCAEWGTASKQSQDLEPIEWGDLTLAEELGQGASGVIYRAVWQRQGTSQTVAVKVFKGDLTSDGSPLDEMQACMAAGSHPHLVSVLGQVVNHPEQKAGLVFPFIEADYKTLGGPPSLASCTRDTYAPETQFPLAVSLRIVSGIAAAVAHLHDCGILHGDLYAHNILSRTSGDSFLSDFGAAGFFDPTDLHLSSALARIEVRAFGCLLEDLLDRCPPPDLAAQGDRWQTLKHLQQACLSHQPSDRPTWRHLLETLDSLVIEP